MAALGRDHTVTDRLAGADVVVHLSPETTREVLAAMGNMTAGRVVLLSSATVYGAWADNPVPITEDAAIRPNPGVEEAARCAEAERLVGEWAAEHPGAKVAVLRPATVVAPGAGNWLADALTGRYGAAATAPEPDRQFVHVDDVVSAIALAVEAGLDGVYNVAPSGAVAADVVRELGAWHLTVPLPRRLSSAASRWGLSPVPAAALPLIEHSWVVASDRIHAAGWAPRYTSEQAVVAARSPGWWREMAPGRRQSAALVGAGVVAVSAAAGVAAAVARARRRLSLGGGRSRR
ncbi:MAG TPA: NAD-dependent epimerase/dehydratase family protein [Acidimicrobiales bacterium]|nr:NAD-dependent epimerase/dehydratase family protein [Acidimicrobiales bacterium]